MAAGAAGRLELLVGEDEAGARVDQALAALAGVSRSQARRWIDEGRVRLAGRAVRAGQRVAAGERIEAEPPEPVPRGVAPEADPARDPPRGRGR